MIKRKMHKGITRNQIREKTASLQDLYMNVEEDKTFGYVSYGGIMMQINPQKGVRISEARKSQFLQLWEFLLYSSNSYSGRFSKISDS